jgi:hypothetical protein
VLIQEIYGDSKIGHSKLDPKEDESIINLIQAVSIYIGNILVDKNTFM